MGGRERHRDFKNRIQTYSSYQRQAVDKSSSYGKLCIFLILAIVAYLICYCQILLDCLDHLILELDHLCVGHQGPVLPVQHIQGLCDVPEPGYGVLPPVVHDGGVLGFLDSQ